MAQSPIDLGKLIIDANSNMLNNSENSKNSQEELVKKNYATGLTDDQAAILTAVIEKANKKHAEEAVNTLGLDGATALVALHNLTSQKNEGESSGSSSEKSPTNSTTPIQQEASNTVLPQNNFHPMELLSNLLGNLTGMRAANQAINSAKLSNLGEAQKILGQQPLQQSEIQKNQLPLTQEQQVQALGSYNTAQITAYNDAATRLTSQIDSLNKTFTEEQKTISPTMQAGALLTGKPAMTDNMVKIQTAIKDLQNRLYDLNKKGPAGVKNPLEKDKKSSGFKVISSRE